MSFFTKTLLLILTTITLFTTLTTCHTDPNRRTPFPKPINQHNKNNDKRQNLLCPVPCDTKWCCYNDQKCIPKNNGNDPAEPYQCDDPLLQTTWLAFQNGQLSSELVAASSLVKSVASEYNLTIPATATPTTTGGDDNAATDTGPITLGSGPTRTGSSSVPATMGTSGAAGYGYNGDFRRGGVSITILAVYWGLVIILWSLTG